MNAGLLYRAHDGVALPAPLPGYALAVFALLSFVPLQPAALLWMFVLLAAVAVAVRSLRALGVPAVASVAALSFPLAAVSMPFGEIVAVALAAGCACAEALRHRAFGRAVAWASVMMIEPHVGVPVMLALVGLERTRWRAAFAIVALAALHAAVVPAEALTYFTAVLPQHALAEIGRTSQYSLAWVLSGLGVRGAYALGIGAASYAIVLGAGISIAAILARRLHRLEMLALVPPAFALFGGTFMHLAQTVIALPTALVFLAVRNQRVHRMAAIAVLLLAIPWNVVAATPWIVPFAAIVCVAVCLWTLRASLRSALRMALACTLMAAALAAGRPFFSVHSNAPVPVLNPAFAEASWGAWIAVHDRFTGPAIWLAKAPTWIGLALFAACAVLLAASEEREVRARGDDAPAVLGA